MPPAARMTDMHVCPMVTPGVPPIPHVGGPILPPGVPTVLIDFLPAATVTDMATCVGPPDVIIMGSTGVFINFLPAARLGDPTAHGGVITLGSPTCIIGEMGAPSPGGAGASAIAAGLVASGVSKPTNAVASAYSGPNAQGSNAAVTPDLSKAQTENLERFTSKLPNGAGEVAISEGENGRRRFTADVPGKVPGSKATYYKEVDASGATILMGKRTYDPSGNLVHDKVKFSSN